MESPAEHLAETFRFYSVFLHAARDSSTVAVDDQHERQWLKAQDKLTGTYETYKSEGDILSKRGEYKKAIDSYTTALRLRQDDQISLVCRSKCHLMLGDHAKALNDAEASLVEDKLYYKGMFQKAEALFSRGDFEMALVFYHRGHNVRPELDIFRLGIKKAQEAIYNCVGTPDRVKLSTSGDLSFFHLQDEKKVRNKGAQCTHTTQTVAKRVRPTKKPGNERTIKEMLGGLYGDRIYLENVLKVTDDISDTGKKIRSVAQSGLTYLQKQTEFWQQVKPVYARKYEARLALKRWKSSKISTHDYIVSELEKIDAFMTDGKYIEALMKGQKLLNLLAKYSERQLSNKMIFTAAVHSAIGSAYYELKDYVNAEEHHLMDKCIGEDCYIDEAERRAMDNLGRVYVGSGNFLKAIEIWEKKLQMSRCPLETTWLCHELGRCYLRINNFRTAKEYGERCLMAANDGHDHRWKLHALVLISQADSKSHRLSSAIINFEKAMEMASLLQDANAENAIKKAIDRVHDKMLQRESGLTPADSVNDITEFTSVKKIPI